MPKYFFNVYHDRADIDSVGGELSDKHAEWREATITAGHMIQSMEGKLQPGTERRIEVTDEFANPPYVTSMRRNRAKPASLPQMPFA
jgi:hypothetical protein